MTIKKLLTAITITCCLICCLQSAFSQVVLSSHHLDMKKAGMYHDILPAPEAKNRGLVVFASDKETVTALRYNRVLYYTDSLVAERPGVSDYDLLAGYSYAANGQPSAYWANADFTKVLEQHFDFETGAVTDYAFQMAYKDEEMLMAFNANNTFYIITKADTGSKLYLYVFNEGRYLRHTLDFSAYIFKDNDNRVVSLSGLLDEQGLQKMEVPAFNPLPSTAGKVKLYVTDGALQLTFDQNPDYTQLFSIDTNTFAIVQKIVPQTVLEDGKSNSFWHKNRLYQVAINKEELSLKATDLTTGEILKTYRAEADDSVTFKNSTLLEQTGNKRPNEFKNTKKFLRKAAWGFPAVSVYQTPNDLLVVTGAIRQSVPAGEVALGGLATVAMVATGVGGDAFGMFADHIQSIYFESLFDPAFNHKDLPQQRLAADYIGQYMYEHKKQVSLEAVFSYGYYYIAGYYDAKAKKYILVKFEDDFVH